MIRFLIGLFDLLHLAANLVFFIIVANSTLKPAAAFIYLPLLLLTIWSLFFALRSYLQRLAENQHSAKKPAAAVLKSPLTNLSSSA
ncbi:hypothetical protein [Kangiella sp. TOML190]|uniref:hypothetical protein n=1 Tax=Kangiella sp. TOML190 TaxID=2931351 RepID=UPI00203A8DCC|nr:hypothetical protein [Kangiella sp. TOML190]